MKCSDFKSKLRAYAEGRLSDAERGQVRSHVQGCVSCRTALAQVDPVAALLLDSQTPPVPAGLAGRVLSAGQRQQRKMPVATWNPVAWWRRVPVAMRMAAVLVLVIGVGAGTGLGWFAKPDVIAERSAASRSILEAHLTDYLGEAPDGSLADSYLTLVMESRKGER